MKLLLIRHGETAWNVEKRIQGSSDIELNDSGIMQANEVGLLIKSRKSPVSSIYTSYLKRARKTAELIGTQLSLPVVTVSGLEEMSLGNWEGHTWDTVALRYKQEFDAWNLDRRYTKVPGGESYQDVLDRFIPALIQITAESAQDSVVVTHSGNIMAFLSFLHDTPFHEMLHHYRTPNTAIVEVDAAELLKKAR